MFYVGALFHANTFKDGQNMAIIYAIFAKYSEYIQYWPNIAFSLLGIKAQYILLIIIFYINSEVCWAINKLNNSSR